MNVVHINKTRPAARTRGRVRGYALRALPWALAAAFFVHLVMERGLHLYRAGPVLTHALEACLAAAVLIWVWRALRRMEDLPEGDVAAPVVDWDRGFWGTKQSRWDDDLPPGYPMVFDRTGMTVEDDRGAIL